MASLNGFSIFGGIVFLIVIFLVIQPLTFNLPLSISRILRKLFIALRIQDKPNASPTHGGSVADEKDHSKLDSVHPTSKLDKRLQIKLDLVWAPLLGVLLLLITTTIGSHEIVLGIAGSEGVKPYDVLILFMSLAYIATALDATGGLRYLAFHVALRAKSGSQLYFYLFTFFFAAGAIIGNDPIILSGTPFLAYLANVSGIDPPTAWIYAQFLAANVSSAVLVSSNPTNVLISGAFSLNFLSGFTKYTVLPSFAAGILVYPFLFFGFRNKKIAKTIHKDASEPLIPHRFDKPDVRPRDALVDPFGAIFHSVLMLITLGVLVGSSFIGGVEVWMVTLPGGLVSLTRDVLYDIFSKRKSREAEAAAQSQRQDKERNASQPEKAANTDSTATIVEPQASSSPKQHQRTTLPSIWRSINRLLPKSSTTFSRLPWPLLPFAIGMFILVRSLDTLGYIPIFASWTAKACTSPAAAVFFVGGIVAFGLCPLCGTNIGATILAVEVLTNAKFANAPHVQADPRILRCAIYAVAMASNTGALVTLPSSLAGLLWSRILGQKGVKVTQVRFSLINLIPACIITFSSLGIVLLEVMYW